MRAVLAIRRKSEWTNKQTAAAATTSELRIFTYFVFAVFVSFFVFFSCFVLLCCTLRSQQRCQQHQPQQERTIMSVALLHAHAHARSLTTPALALPLSLSVLLSLSLTLCLLRFVVVSSSCKRSLNNFVCCQKLFIFKSSATLKVLAPPPWTALRPCGSINWPNKRCLFGQIH